MAYKNKEDRIKYDKEYYLKVRKPKYIPHPLIKKTREEKLAIRRAWYHANLDRARAIAKKSWVKHKEQRKLDNKIWVEKNKDWVKQYHQKYHKEYYLKNKEKIDFKNKLYVTTHREKIVKNVQRYVSKNKNKVVKYRNYYERTINGKYRQLKNRSKIFGEETDITIERFREIISQQCFYCGENKKPRGIDRVDNAKGYTKENSVPCCKLCNFMKKAMTKKDFILHIEKIHNFQKLIN